MASLSLPASKGRSACGCEGVSGPVALLPLLCGPLPAGGAFGEAATGRRETCFTPSSASSLHWSEQYRLTSCGRTVGERD